MSYSPTTKCQFCDNYTPTAELTQCNEDLEQDCKHCPNCGEDLEETCTTNPNN